MADDPQFVNGSEVAAPPWNLPSRQCWIDRLMWVGQGRPREKLGRQLSDYFCHRWPPRLRKLFERNLSVEPRHRRPEDVQFLSEPAGACHHNDCACLEGGRIVLVPEIQPESALPTG